MQPWKTFLAGSLPWILAGIAAGPHFPALAQVPDPEQETKQLSGVQKEVLTRVHRANLTEIQLGDLARSRGGSQEVRAFGDRLVRDHSFADRRIREAAEDEKITLKEGEPPANQAEMVRKFEGLRGPEFDREFVNAMRESRTESIAMLRTAYDRLPDIELRELIGKFIPVLGQHRQLAQNIQSRLGGR